jgi:hypothetical protein
MSAGSQLSSDERRWLDAYRATAVEYRHTMLLGVENAARSFPQRPEPRLRLVREPAP